MIFTFTDNGTSIKAGDQPESKFYGDAKFSQSLLRMWFINPQDPDLMRGFLRKWAFFTSKIQWLEESILTLS